MNFWQREEAYRATPTGDQCCQRRKAPAMPAARVHINELLAKERGNRALLTEDKCCQRRRAPARLAGRAYVDALRTWQGAFPYEIRYSLQRFISAQCAAVSGRTPAKRARTGYKECGFIREDGTLLTALGGGSARAGKDAREPSGRDMPVSGFANRPALRDWRRACGHGGAKKPSVLSKQR